MNRKCERIIGVIGLGYVGLPVAFAFSQKNKVVGFDVNEKRIEELKNGFDYTNEICQEELSKQTIDFTHQLEDLESVNFFIITVPTPIDDLKRPDLSLLYAASKTVGQVLKKGDVVVFESTVYPGVTEDHCLPILEETSKLKLGDFKIGYSPERINPGDKEHTFSKIKKVVSACDDEATEIIAETYGAVVDAGLFKASSIKVAEAAKIIENTQRDLNISLMNELALIFEKMNIDTNEVIEAASTKWNFLPFRPGLVGGHCIGVDPYYLTHEAERLGHIPQVILAGRNINDSMGKYIAEKTVKEMVKVGVNVSDSKVGILGVTFKENCGDTRNSKVFDIVKELKTYGIKVLIHDPLADKKSIEEAYSIKISEWNEISKLDALILAVPHSQYRELNHQKLDELCQEKAILIDIKNTIPKKVQFKNIKKVWRL